jgi:hypothetical protein
MHADTIILSTWQEELLLRSRKTTTSSPTANKTRSVHAYYKHLDRFSIGKALPPLHSL